MSLSRFMCPRCDEALTPWLRPLPTAEALCMTSSWTWLLPAEHYLHREDPRLGAPWNSFSEYPWLLPPQPERKIKHHPDGQRTIGCCGLSYRGPDQPNLVCACGEVIGLGYCDCCGPHWYALHASVRREEVEEEDSTAELVAGLAHLQRICGGGPATAIVAARDRYNGVLHDDPETWPAAHRLAEIGLACSGGEADPELLLTSPQLPDGLPLVLPIPRGQLVRLIVLQSTPWGEPDLPMIWQGDRKGAPHVQVSRRDDRILLTLWPGQTVTAVTIPAVAWTAAWVRLCSSLGSDASQRTG